MAYTTINKSTDYFNTKLYTGNSGTQTISGIGHQPDLIWGKNRASNRHFLSDSVRGKKTTGYYLLCTNNTEADTSNSASDGITSINSDGFVLGANASNTDGGWSYELNGNARNFVAWNWKAGGSASSNSDGTITSSVSASTTAGFSIMSYTGTGSAGTVGHGLGTKPNLIIFKGRNTTSDFPVYIDPQNDGSLEFVKLNSTDAKTNSSFTWDNTKFTFDGGSSYSNTSGTNYIAYCFSEKTGFSKIGSYIGNGNAEGTFVYTGFKPAWVMIKKTNDTHAWRIYDSVRDTHNLTEKILEPNTSNAEATSGTYVLDLVSNGFKFRGNGDGVNGSGQSFIYMAFAEAPLVGSNNVPCTAR